MSAQRPSPSETRLIGFSADSCKLPEKLLLAHSRGEVLFVAGAGASMPAGLPDFRTLVLQIYERFDKPLFDVLSVVPRGACDQWHVSRPSLRPHQLAEARRFVRGDYDVAIGMLERRIDDSARSAARVRQAIAEILREGATAPSAVHRSIVKLADRGVATAVVTTNFDLLLEGAGRLTSNRLESYSLGAMPRPGKSPDFAGVMHIHGALGSSPARSGQFIVSDRDFGEYYLRRQVVPEFIYDAARLFSIVLVGYSASDPPMRYLLNAVAADGSRFTDLKERYAFVAAEGAPDEITLADWRARGITPIPYDGANGHAQLRSTLANWAKYSPINGNMARINRLIKHLVKRGREGTQEEDRDLFDHLFRRGNSSERRAMAALVGSTNASPDWLQAMLQIAEEQPATL